MVVEVRKGQRWTPENQRVLGEVTTGFERAEPIN